MPQEKKFGGNKKLSIRVPTTTWEFLKEHPEIDKSEIFEDGFKSYYRGAPPSRTRNMDARDKYSKRISELKEYRDKAQKNLQDVEAEWVAIKTQLSEEEARETAKILELWPIWRSEKMSRFGRDPPPHFQSDWYIEEWWRAHEIRLTRGWIYLNWTELDDTSWPDKFPSWYPKPPIVQPEDAKRFTVGHKTGDLQGWQLDPDWNKDPADDTKDAT